MGRFDLTDEEWAIIEPHFPKRVRGPERVDDRKILNGIFYILRTGAPGAIFRNATGRAQRFTIVTTDGAGAASGRASLMRWRVNEKTA